MSARPVRVASVEVGMMVVPPGQTCIAVRRHTGTLAPMGSVVSKLAALSEGALAATHVWVKKKVSSSLGLLLPSVSGSVSPANTSV